MRELRRFANIRGRCRLKWPKMGILGANRGRGGAIVTPNELVLTSGGYHFNTCTTFYAQIWKWKSEEIFRKNWLEIFGKIYNFCGKCYRLTTLCGWQRVYDCAVPSDPEGILGIMTSVVLCIIGVQVTHRHQCRTSVIWVNSLGIAVNNVNTWHCLRDALIQLCLNLVNTRLKVFDLQQMSFHS